MRTHFGPEMSPDRTSEDNYRQTLLCVCVCVCVLTKGQCRQPQVRLCVCVYHTHDDSDVLCCRINRAACSDVSLSLRLFPQLFNVNNVSRTS